MKLIIEHHHYIHSGSDEPNARLLNLILKNQHKMNENLEQIKADLLAANTKADKIQADVALLHSKIDSIPGDVPTVEEWAEVKQLSTDLNNKLQGIDDQTAEEPTPEP